MLTLLPILAYIIIIIMLEFEWYSEKERLIAEKHGLDMDMIKQIFADPFRIIQYDVVHSGLEDRWQVLGKVNEVLFAVYTERAEKIRIITAREATPEERRIYYGTNKNESWFIP
jgi:uncharacterized DUF497 family protein